MDRNQRRTDVALFDDMLKGAGGSVLVAGAAALLLAPLVLPVVGRALRPVAKTVLKTGIVLYRDLSHQVEGAMSGIVDEARAELAGQTRPPQATRTRGQPHGRAKGQG